jgi:hypothetical protein
MFSRVQNCRELRRAGTSPQRCGALRKYLAIKNQPAPKMIDPPLQERLALGVFWAQYRVENLRILPDSGREPIRHLHGSGMCISLSMRAGAYQPIIRFLSYLRWDALCQLLKLGPVTTSEPPVASARTVIVTFNCLFSQAVEIGDDLTWIGNPQ